MDLQADRIQGVLFLSPNQPQDDAPKIWERLFGSDTAETTQRVPNNPFLASMAAGEIDSHYVTIVSQVGNISITVSKRSLTINQDQQTPQRLSAINTVTQLLATWMADIAEKLKLLRIGLVLDLSCNPEPGEENGRLRSLLPGLDIPPDAIDVMIQMNFQTQFPSSSGVTMNRFCQWNSGQMATIQVQVPQLSALPVSQMPVATQSFIGFKIDVNSVQGMLISDELKRDLIANLADEAVAIQQEGYVRFIK